MARYTPRQRDLLEFVGEYQRIHAVSPTLEEIGEQFGYTRVTAFQHVSALQRKGAILRRPREARSLEIVDPAYRPQPGIPILGTIAAGRPLEALDAKADGGEHEVIDLRDLIPTRGDYFFLRVKGDSMIDDHIEDGDLVLVERRATADDGDTVVAILPGDGVEEATLKRFYRETGGTVRLEPRNPRLKPIRSRKVQVRGIVRGILRRL